MKGYAKIRLAIFLSIMLVLPSIVSVLPMTAQEASAASNVSLYWNYYFSSSDTSTVQIEKGAKFNIGDYAYLWFSNSNYGCASQYKNTKYSSSKKSVISVNSKGVVTAKKTGKATITIKYKGKKITKKLQVVKAGTFSDSDAVKGAANQIKKLANNMPSKITASNGYKYLNILVDYENYVNDHSTEISKGGMLLEPIDSGSYTYYGNSNKLVVPQAGRIFALEQLLNKYADKNSPISTTCSKRLKISSASASTKGITIKTKQKVTAAHILAANIASRHMNDGIDKKSVDVYVTVNDNSYTNSYVAIATLEKGSKTIKVKLGKYEWNSEKKQNEFVTIKLKKGRTYIIGNDIQWGGGKKVKAK